METTPVATEKIGDTRWALSSHTLEDTGCPAGEHTYRLVVSDPSGNTIIYCRFFMPFGGVGNSSAVIVS